MTTQDGQSHQETTRLSRKPLLGNLSYEQTGPVLHQWWEGLRPPHRFPVLRTSLFLPSRGVAPLCTTPVLFKTSVEPGSILWLPDTLS